MPLPVPPTSRPPGPADPSTPPGEWPAQAPLRADDLLAPWDDNDEAGLQEGGSPSPLDEEDPDATEEGEGQSLPDEDEDVPGYARRSRPSTSYARQRSRQDKPPRQGSRSRAGESRHSARRLQAVETQRRALELRMAGLSYLAIASKLELKSPQTAWNMVESALQRTLQEPADHVRKLELGRLDALFALTFAKALQFKDMQATAQALNIMQRRARLIGLDAPVQTATTLDVNGGGILVTGPVMDPETWEKYAKAQQAKAVTELPAHVAAAPGGAGGADGAVGEGAP